MYWFVLYCHCLVVCLFEGMCLIAGVAIISGSWQASLNAGGLGDKLVFVPLFVGTEQKQTCR